ncbi:GAF domain-containing protein [Halosimplex aquaticum]|uniref:GAF domain-containing protein n=1 Tax=Halosimplex aquaticum TaxID=3026162 RepID=A0ABD5Y5E2_9EURY|nr:GAF domain-containing protein [Halosimplex aquaticum]
MPHTVCTGTQSGVLSYLKRLWDRLLAPDLDMATKLEREFANETDELGLDYAFLSRIDREADRFTFEIVHGPGDRLERSVSVPLACTYCRKTIADPGGTMAVSDALAEGWDGDRAYERFGFRSYVGTTVTVEGDLYGTLCFADTAPRAESIRSEERALVEMLGRWVTYELNQWTGPPTDETVSHNLGEHDSLRSPQIDSIMDALAKRPRRLILLALLDDSVETSLDGVERVADDSLSRVALRHAHLPKLEQTGYVEWHPAADRFSRGPNFREIEPFLRLLREYTVGCSR